MRNEIEYVENTETIRDGRYDKVKENSRETAEWNPELIA